MGLADPGVACIMFDTLRTSDPMTTVEERVSSLAGAYEHLATKADIQEVRAEMQQLRGEMKSDMRSMETRLVKWVAGIMIGTMLGSLTATAALLRLFL